MGLYEILKASKLGAGAAPDMYTALLAQKIGKGGSGGEAELSGVPPLTFRSNGTPLIDYLISGNTTQTGTPSPASPIMPQGTGERTGNLLNLNRTYSGSFTTDTTKWMNGAATVNNVGITYAETEIQGDAIKVTSKNSGYGASFLIEASPNTTYTVSFETDKASSGSWGGISDRDINGTVISSSAIQGKSATFTTHDNCAFLNVCFRFPPADGTVTFSKIMLNLGSTPKPYEPYGYKIPISSANTTTPVYLGEVETTRKIKKLVLDGTENWQNADGWFYLTSVTDDYLRSEGNITSMCSHYPTYKQSSAIAQLPEGYTGFSWGSVQRLYLKDTSHRNDLSGFKQWLAAQYAAGTPVTVWYVLATEETAVVNEPLMRIGDYADTLSKEQALVSIPTNNGSTTVDVDTTVKPSEVYIKYMGG